MICRTVCRMWIDTIYDQHTNIRKAKKNIGKCSTL